MSLLCRIRRAGAPILLVLVSLALIMSCDMFFGSKVNADAGADQTVAVGETVTLDGGDSTGDNLDYRWTIKTKPSGSAASITSSTEEVASFVADIQGSYVIELLVSNSNGSDTDTVQITAGEGGTVAVTGVTMSQSTLGLVIGTSHTLTAAVTPSNATNQSVTWTSTNPSVASVSSQGLVTAGNTAGQAIITVTTADGQFTASCVVSVTLQAVPVDSITLGEGTATIQVGQTHLLSYVILPINATSPTVTWSSDNTGVATVSSGLVTAKATGTATITAATQGKTSTCTVTVVGVPVSSVSVTPSSTTILKGNTQTLVATVLPSNASDKGIAWTSANTNVATVNPATGVVTAVAAGTTVITATSTFDNTKYGSCVVTVAASAVAVSSVSLSPTSLSLAVGGQHTLVATIAPSNATNQNLTWTSASPSIATVVNGLVTGIAAGSTAITVITQDGNKVASCAVTVTSSVSVTGVSLSQHSAGLQLGGTLNLYANIAPSNATNMGLAWSSTNTSVATVDGTGKVSAVTAGSATIVVVTLDGSFSDTCAVTVSTSAIPVESVVVAPTSLSMKVGENKPLTATVSPATATNQAVNWSSSNTDVAVVNSSGVVTAQAGGSATITAMTVDGGFISSCAITVTVPVTSVSLSQTNVIMNAGTTVTLSAQVYPTNASNKAVTWSSSNTGVATVASGVITAKAAGSATITVMTADGSKTATCSVSVQQANTVPAAPSAPSPATAATGVAYSGLTLSWSCSDADGDALRYDLYFGSGTMSLLASNLASASYTLTSLNANSAYSWKVVAKDYTTGGAAKGGSTSGPVWTFTTLAATGNQPPSVNSAYATPNQMIVGGSTTLYCNASDPENGLLSYTWTVSSAPAGAAYTIDYSTSSMATLNVSAMDGTYYITVSVSDDATPINTVSYTFPVFVNPNTSGGYGYGIQ